MSQPGHDGIELIPRPEQNPAALGAALAVVAADRLPEMLDGRTEAMAEAIETASVQPPRSFVAHWSAAVEIERHPVTARAHHRANCLANHAATPAECREHATTVAEFYRATSPNATQCDHPDERANGRCPPGRAGPVLPGVVRVGRGGCRGTGAGPSACRVAGRGVGRVGQLKITERNFRRLPSFLPGFME